VALVDGVKLAPSILAADFACLGEQVRAAEQAGADYIHIDIMDGHFVPPITMGPLIVDAVKRSCGLKLDVHLMIEEPEVQIGQLKDAGADLLTVHVEAKAGRHLHRVLRAIKDAGLRAGVAINPATHETAITEILEMVDLLLVMTINPGWGGQKFLPSTRPKLRRVRQLIDASGRLVELEVDGGINESTAAQVVADGADVLVAGSAIFNPNEPVADAAERLRRALQAPHARVSAE
jgi:ribulose-phosphate 3-epimerase